MCHMQSYLAKSGQLLVKYCISCLILDQISLTLREHGLPFGFLYLFVTHLTTLIQNEIIELHINIAWLSLIR